MKNLRGMTETGHIFEQWAKHLETKASGLVMASTVGGGLIGAALGGVSLLRLSNAVVPHHLGYATLLIGAAAGAYLGWRFGERRATGLRLQAEVTRRQFQVEQSLIRRVMQLAPTPPVQQAPVQQPPVQQPPVIQPAPLAPPPPVAAPPPPPPPAPAPVPPPMVPAPVTPLLTTPAPTAPAVPPVVSPISAPTPEPPPAAAYAPHQAV
jgi:hypothetical protein